MISAFTNIWRVPELRDRILFTLFMIIIVRLGAHITIPGVDSNVLDEWTKNYGNSSSGGNPLTAMLTVFSGGALQQAGIFALGIMPYISASIMLQLMTAVVPKLSKLSREDGGRQKISQWTRYIALVIALVQGFFLIKTLTNADALNNIMPGISKLLIATPLVPQAGATWWFPTALLIIVTGTMLLMWIGDQMTERGIGNGTSIIIMVNIISALPGALILTWKTFTQGADQNLFNPLKLVFMIAFLIFVIAAVIAITQGQRRILVQYAKRVVGKKQFGGQQQYMPLKVNYAGVMPIIFVSAVISLPVIIMQQIGYKEQWFLKLTDAIGHGWAYYVLGAVGIFFFSYFWVATMFQPSQISEDLKRNGGYIPGVRPGQPTAEFLDYTMTRLTFAGAIFLTIIFFLPFGVAAMMKLPGNSPITQFFGGTSLLILVGVVLDVMRQVETHLLQRHYDGFLRKGKLKGRYDRLAQTGNAASSSVLVYLGVIVAVLAIAGAIIWGYDVFGGK